MRDSVYAFPMSIQTTLPDKYRGKEFRQILDLLEELDFTGVELNVTCPEEIDPLDLQAVLDEHGLKMTMFASGATAKAEDLSLSHLDERVRSASVERCRSLIDYAAEFEAGIIVGFLKGAASPNQAQAGEQFVRSIAEIENHAHIKRVPCLIEATNHYESSVANSLADTAEVIQRYDNPYLRILPDTYHMNIEESSMFGALVRFRNLYDNLHISDNNRLFPGLGAIDFFAVLRFLKEIGHSGGIAIEGRVQDSLEADLRASMKVLKPMLLQV